MKRQKSFAVAFLMVWPSVCQSRRSRGTAKAAGIGGIVEVAVVIDENGNIESAQAVKDEKENAGVAVASNEVQAFRDAAETAALEAACSPTLLSGKPVRCWASSCTL